MAGSSNRLVEEEDSVSMHPHDIFVQPAFLQSVWCVGTEFSLFPFQKMSHVGRLAVFVSAILDLMGRKS